MTSISKHIRRLRRKRKWTVADLASRLGVSPRTVEGYEQGRKPSQPVTKLLARLGVRN